MSDPASVSNVSVTGVTRSCQNHLIVPPGHTIYQAVGCHECHHAGYGERIAIFKLLPINPQLRALCNREAFAAQIHAVAFSEGIQTLR